jgi:hypothetical protein
MITFDPLQFVVVAFVACGLLAVILEIALKDPRDLWDMIDDVRYFARHPKSAAPAEHPKSPVPHDPRLSV